MNRHSGPAGAGSAGAAQAAAPARQAGVIQGVVLILASLFPIMGFTTLTPALPRMLDHFRNVPGADVLVPVAATMPYLAIALFSPIAGAVADRFGRRRLMLFAAAIYGFSGLAPLVLDTLPAVLVSRFAVGVSEAAIQSISLALIGDYFKGRERVKWITLQPVILTLGSAVLTVISGWLAEISWRAPFAIYSVTFLIFAGIWRFIWEPPHESPAAEVAGGSSPPAAPFPWGLIVGICLISMTTAVMLIAGPVQFGFVAKLRGITSPAIIGYVLGAGSLIGVTTGAGIFNRLSAQPTPLLIGVALAVAGAGLAGIGTLHHVLALAVAVTLVNLGFGLLNSTMLSWTLRILSFSQRGRGVGLWSMALFGGQFLSPLVMAPVNGVTGGLLASLQLFGITLMAVAAGCLLLAANRYRRRAAPG